MNRFLYSSFHVSNGQEGMEIGFSIEKVCFDNETMEIEKMFPETNRTKQQIKMSDNCLIFFDSENLVAMYYSLQQTINSALKLGNKETRKKIKDTIEFYQVKNKESGFEATW